jgi:hypothetical protein
MPDQRPLARRPRVLEVNLYRRSSMTRYSKIALGCTAAFGLLVGTQVATAQEGIPEPAAADPVTVVLEPVNDAAASGVALIQETAEGQTALELEVRGAGEEPLVAVLATGTCEAPGEIRAALGTVVRDDDGDAQGHFVLGDPIDAVVGTPTVLQIQAEGPDATPVACGQVGALAADEPFDVPAATPIPDPIPTEDLDEDEADEIIGDDMDEGYEAEAEDEAEAEAQD